jgi:DNA topoisomerase-1
LVLGLSLPAITPEEVTLNEALTLIKAKEKFDAERIIKTFDDSEIQVLNGRFGPYIAQNQSYIFDINL